MPRTDLLAGYLNDHAAASAGTARRTQRIITSHPADIDVAVFEPPATEITGDRTTSSVIEAAAQNALAA